MNAADVVERVNRRCPELDPIRTRAEHWSEMQVAMIASVLPAVFAEAFDVARRDKRPEAIETCLDAFEEQRVARAEIGHETAGNVARAVARVLRTALIEEKAQIKLALPRELDCLPELHQTAA